MLTITLKSTDPHHPPSPPHTQTHTCMCTETYKNMYIHRYSLTQRCSLILMLTHTTYILRCLQHTHTHTRTYTHMHTHKCSPCNLVTLNVCPKAIAESWINWTWHRHSQTRTHTHTYMHTRTSEHMQTHINTCAHTGTHTHSHSYTYTLTHRHRYRHRHMYTHTHTHRVCTIEI